LSDKDSAIDDFLTTLKVAFKTATMYNMDHPAFQKVVADLMAKVTALLTTINPLSISFTPNSLFLDNRFWEKDKTYIELARIFHFRKIKTLEIRQGLEPEELVRFASKVTLPLKSFIREGGAQNILKKERILHLSVEELDYSQLLKGEGEEIKDIWPYLLMEAVEENNNQKLEQVAESFERVIGKFNTEDLIQNEELQKNFFPFFKYLKETGQEKYRRCAQDLLKSVLVSKKMPAESKFDNLKLLFADLDDADLASTLWEEIISNPRFDALSFSVFSKVVTKDRHLKISTSLRDLFKTDHPLNRKPEVEAKIKALLSGRSGPGSLSENYRRALTSLLQEISFDKKVSFDHHLLRRNYRFILLNVLDKQTKKDLQVRNLQRISEEWKEITQDRDLDYLKILLEVLQKKEKDLAEEPAFQKVRASISDLVENLILGGETSPALNNFIISLKTSIFDRNVYLEKIFRGKMVTPVLLRAYFGFFNQYLFDFYAQLKRKTSEIPLLENIVEGLKFIDTPISLMALKKIFSYGDLGLKIKALRAMQDLTEYDEKFLSPLLEKRNMPVKAEALLILMRNDKAKRRAFEKLLQLESPYGLRNKTLLRHIKIVEEKNVKEARPYLMSLAERKSFWNRKVRGAALLVLEKWREG